MNTKLNKSDWLVLVVIYGINLIFNTVDYYKADNTLIEYLIDFPVSLFLSIIMILIFLYRLIPQFLIEKRNYILFLFFGLLTFTLLGSLDNFVGNLTGGESLEKIKFNFEFFEKGLFNGVDSIAFPFAVLLAKKFYEGQTELFKAQKRQKENELKLLRSQLDPHFLFNNLNTLDALIDSDSAKAKEYINRLSLIYRYLIQTKDSEVMELSEELKFAENYIFLIRTRFGNDYNFSIEKTAEIHDRFIPTGAIQTLLENVVKHNKVSNGSTINTTIEIDEIKLTTTNNKSKNSNTNESFGTGLKNLKSRYKLLSDKQVMILNTDEKFIVKIPILNLET